MDAGSKHNGPTRQGPQRESVKYVIKPDKLVNKDGNQGQMIGAGGNQQTVFSYSNDVLNKY